MSATQAPRWQPRDWAVIILMTALASLTVFTIRYLLVVTARPDYSDAPIQRSYYAQEGGWEIVLPEDAGLTDASVRRTDHYFRESSDAAAAMLVVRNNVMGWEAYYPRNRVTKIISVPMYEGTRLMTATLIGAAIQAGYIRDVNQTVGDFYPEYFADHPNPAYESITIEELLTNRSGIDWADNSSRLQPNRDSVMQLLELPLLFEPGTEWRNSGADAHLLMGILEEATGMEVMEFASEYVFEPLGIIERQWFRDQNGRPIGAAGLELRPGNIAVLGQLYLNQGYYNGVQILPRNWVEQSTQPYATVQEADPATGQAEVTQGYMWMVTEKGGTEAWMSVGFGGQYLVVFPEFDMVVVLVNSTYIIEWVPEQFRTTEGLLAYDIFDTYFVPMARGEDVPPVNGM